MWSKSDFAIKDKGKITAPSVMHSNVLIYLLSSSLFYFIYFYIFYTFTRTIIHFIIFFYSWKECLKGKITQKWINLSSFTHPHIVQHMHDFCE